MTTKLKEVDVVIVGLGWTGGILAKELTEAGMKVVALERGGMRTSENDYSWPNIRAHARYVVRQDLALDRHGIQDPFQLRGALRQEIHSRGRDDSGLGHQLRRARALL